MIAGVQSPARKIVAVHRTYLRLDGRGKAGVEAPKKALVPSVMPLLSHKGHRSSLRTALAGTEAQRAGPAR